MGQSSDDMIKFCLQSSCDNWDEGERGCSINTGKASNVKHNPSRPFEAVLTVVCLCLFNHTPEGIVDVVAGALLLLFDLRFVIGFVFGHS